MILYESNFSNEKSMDDFIKNGVGEVYIKNNKLYLDDSKDGKGLTVWNKKEFSGDLKISFDAYVEEPALASNVNFFFMAKKTGGEAKDILDFSGSYAEYHENADLYIVTLTGDFENLHGRSNIGYSRMRKDPGFNLLNETYDIKAKVNSSFHFEITKITNEITIKINNKLIHKYIDENPYNQGLIGFRTYYTKLYFENLKVEA